MKIQNLAERICSDVSNLKKENINENIFYLHYVPEGDKNNPKAEKNPFKDYPLIFCQRIIGGSKEHPVNNLIISTETYHRKSDIMKEDISNPNTENKEKIKHRLLEYSKVMDKLIEYIENLDIYKIVARGDVTIIMQEAH